MSFSKYGKITINNSALKQSIEIVRLELMMISAQKNLQYYKEVIKEF